jgi:hypothetical protein
MQRRFLAPLDRTVQRAQQQQQLMTGLVGPRAVADAPQRARSLGRQSRRARHMAEVGLAAAVAGSAPALATLAAAAAASAMRDEDEVQQQRLSTGPGGSRAQGSRPKRTNRSPADALLSGERAVRARGRLQSEAATRGPAASPASPAPSGARASSMVDATPGELGLRGAAGDGASGRGPPAGDAREDEEEEEEVLQQQQQLQQHQQQPHEVAAGHGDENVPGAHNAHAAAAAGAEEEEEEEEEEEAAAAAAERKLERSPSLSSDTMHSSSPDRVPEPRLAARPLTVLEEHLLTLRQLEARHRFYNPAARYLVHRRLVVDWLSELAERADFSTQTTLMAVTNFDRVCSAHSVAPSQLHLVAFCCLLVTAKFDEPDFNLPTIESLLEKAGNVHRKDEVVAMEWLVLGALKWSLNIAVPVHFVLYYLGEGVVFEDDIIRGRRVTVQAIEYARKYALFFCELVSQDYDFAQYPASLMSAAIIASSRHAMQIEPAWNEPLAITTGYTSDQMRGCCQHLFRVFKTSFPAASPTSYPSPTNVCDIHFE